MELRKVVYPGSEAKLRDGSSFIVYPFSLSHAEAATNGIDKMWKSLIEALNLFLQGAQQPGGMMAGVSLAGTRLVSVLLGDLKPILQQGVNVDLSTLSQWDLWIAVAAWIKENFAEEKKIDPFVQLVKMAVENLKRKKPDGTPTLLVDWTLEEWSDFSFKAASTLTTFCDGIIAGDFRTKGGATAKPVTGIASSWPPSSTAA